MGFFLALFAKVEQLCGRFFFSFERKLLVTANNKKKRQKNPQTKIPPPPKKSKPLSVLHMETEVGGGCVYFTCFVYHYIISISSQVSGAFAIRRRDPDQTPLLHFLGPEMGFFSPLSLKCFLRDPVPI